VGQRGRTELAVDRAEVAEFRFEEGTVAAACPGKDCAGPCWEGRVRFVRRRRKRHGPTRKVAPDASIGAGLDGYIPPSRAAGAGMLAGVSGVQRKTKARTVFHFENRDYRTEPFSARSA
jgi:hypothetical protein